MFSVLPTDITASGINSSTAVVGSTVDVHLKVGEIKPKANIFWTVNGVRQVDTTQGPSGDNPDGTFNIQATYTYTYTKTPEIVAFSYAIKEGDINGDAILENDYETVHVICKTTINI